ncbi:hypothetical protein BOO88_12465 [Stutzerimonas stutzeri]|nr:hypothetical protein BOO89_06425 [Stutzerimonas stutzeri]AZO89701.1 hypothetical protein BOO88_12465 [Stutzerimonas stutzeri]
MNHETFAGRQPVEQLADQIEVGAVAFFVGLADVFGVTDQAPEHHPHPEQFRVHDPGRKRAFEKGIDLLRRCLCLFDFLEQGSGQLAREPLVGVGDQCLDAAEVMVEQTHGHPGFGGDAPHGDPGVTVAAQAAQGGRHQHFAAVFGFGATVFLGIGCHKAVPG